MREAMFIKKNVDKWNEYQQVKADSPDETAERFVTLVDDLSYSKTFYPHSQVTRWINGIAGIFLLHALLYFRKIEHRGRRPWFCNYGDFLSDVIIQLYLRAFVKWTNGWEKNICY